MKNKIAKVLIIAGSDPSGGAGLQADIKTATAHKVYASAVVTCLTAQSTVRVADVFYAPIEFLRLQLEEVLQDIEFDAIKIGMLGNAEIIDCVADVVQKYKKDNTALILDTVMVATSGDVLLAPQAVKSLKSRLLNKAFLVTPNIDEAQILAQMSIKTVDDMKRAALKIKDMGAKNVLIKGGHLQNEEKYITNILLDEKGKFHAIKNKKLPLAKIHGTGCTLASAIACNIAKKHNLLASTKKANEYVYKAIVKNLKIGKGSLVLKHF